MDATPDLKRLAPVENLAIDVISYAHGSVTPTLTNLYSKGKESFLKVYKILLNNNNRWCLSLLLFFLSCKRELFFFVLSSNERTNESDDFEWDRRWWCSSVVRSLIVRARATSWSYSLKSRAKVSNFFPFFFDEPSSSSSSSVAIWRSRQKF